MYSPDQIGSKKYVLLNIPGMFLVLETKVQVPSQPTNQQTTLVYMAHGWDQTFPD